MRTINTRKATGADGIPPKLVQMVAQEFTPTVHDLFGTSLVTISDSLYAETHQCFLAKSILELKTREKQENCRDFKSTSQEVHK